MTLRHIWEWTCDSCGAVHLHRGPYFGRPDGWVTETDKFGRRKADRCDNCSASNVVELDPQRKARR